jgi:hypothetical protein
MGRVTICLLWALLIAGPAFATPTTYTFTGGYVEISAVRVGSGAVILSTTQIPMSGSFVDFDDGGGNPANIELSDLLITIPTTSPISLDIPYGGYDTFVIESADLSPAAGYSTLFVQDLGGGFYTFAAGPLDINGIYAASDSNNVNPALMNIVVPIPDNSLLQGVIMDTNTGTLTLSGLTLATLPAGAFIGETEDLQFKADITFYGVPEPGTGLLLGLGLIGLASSRRINFLK